MPPIVDISGKRFGRLLVISEAGRCKYGRATWNCLCCCGNKCVIRSNSLRSGNATSCGCFHKDRLQRVPLKHGERKWRTKEYNSWRGMINRCENEKSISYKHYGARGIKVCRKWRASFTAFLKDMGRCPGGCSLDRKKVNQNYTPRNCRWATHEQQANNQRKNKRLKFNGVTRTQSEWSRITGIPSARIYQRLNLLGWSVSRALTEL